VLVSLHRHSKEAQAYLILSVCGIAVFPLAGTLPVALLVIGFVAITMSRASIAIISALCFFLPPFKRLDIRSELHAGGRQ